MTFWEVFNHAFVYILAGTGYIALIWYVAQDIADRNKIIGRFIWYVAGIVFPISLWLALVNMHEQGGEWSIY